MKIPKISKKILKIFRPLTRTYLYKYTTVLQMKIGAQDNICSLSSNSSYINSY